MNMNVLKNISIGKRLIVGFALVMILMLGIVLPAVISNINSVVKKAEERELKSLFESANAEIESEGRLGEALSSLVATLQAPPRLMAEGDRDTLALDMVPVFKKMNEAYAVKQFQFHTPPATSFLRAHKAEKFGDDLSSFRATVVETNNSKKTVRGLEKGVAGLGIRGIAPMFYQGQHIGSVEFGMSFGQRFFDQFKSKYGAEISLYLHNDGGYKAFGTTLQGEPLLSQREMDAAMSGEVVVGQHRYGQTPYAVLAKRVLDFSGNAVGVLEIAMDRSHYVTAIATARNTTLTIGIVALILGMAVAGLIAVSISRPIRAAVDAMDDIAAGQGDLTKRLQQNGKDEVAMLSTAFNRFAEKVCTIVRQVAQVTGDLNKEFNDLSGITNRTNNGAQQQLNETDQVATARNQMTATVQEVARHATDASRAAMQADDEAKSGREVVNKTIDSIDALVREVEKAATVNEKLDKDSEKIGAVLDVIRGIAEQTNLLALNAAIEAARAGDQGRGFAVVADEVRTLASRTQESTQDIQQMIERLQSGAREAVKAMVESRGQTERSVSQAAEAQASLARITDAVTTISDMNIQIASAAEEQTSVAEEINKNVLTIRDIVEHTAEGAHQSTAACERMSALAGDLQKLVSRFKT